MNAAIAIIRQAHRDAQDHVSALAAEVKTAEAALDAQREYLANARMRRDDLDDALHALRAARRGAQCDGTCTADCGHCKGGGQRRGVVTIPRSPGQELSERVAAITGDVQ